MSLRLPRLRPGGRPGRHSGRSNPIRRHAIASLPSVARNDVNWDSNGLRVVCITTVVAPVGKIVVNVFEDAAQPENAVKDVEHPEGIK